MLALLVTLATGPAAGQSWNDSSAVDLVRRAIARRAASRPDSVLSSYQAMAHGFVFFLGQMGDSLQGSPRLIKVDELRVQVYWRAPGLGKQVIEAWRDGRWLPTDIVYHRDHLGIVTDNFGDRIRIGEGQEVRDAPHPLAGGGELVYQFQLADSLRFRSRAGEITIRNVRVRPRDPSRPAVVGTMGIDAATGELVLFRFSFTPASYRDPSLEDISVTLENAQFEQHYWLPWHQEVEIRRRVPWLDFPVRSIIRTRWEIGDYVFDVPMPPEVAAGPSIGGLLAPVDTAGGWTEPLATAAGEAVRPVEQGDIDAIRAEAARIALARGLDLSGVRPTRVGVSSLSELARVNRVQGLALGFGVSLRLGLLAVRPDIGLGTSDHRVTGGVRLSRGWGPTTIGMVAERRVAELSDQPVRSALVNSILAQEGGRDLGDYTLLDRVELALDRRLGSGTRLGLAAGAERSTSIFTEATPAAGQYRPNPALGVGTIGIARGLLQRRTQSADRRSGDLARLEVEGGTGARDYLRATAGLELLRPTGTQSSLLVRLTGGVGTSELPGYRSFALGGWGTLLGEPFRAWGGRAYTLAHAEWRIEVPVPAIPLGAFASTGPALMLAPFLSAGWAGGELAGLPWTPSRRVRPVLGMAVEWPYHLLRVEVGLSPRTGRAGVSVDFNRELWGVL
jgi:hypothetical protein